MKPEQLNEIRRQVFTALPEIIKQTAAEKPADTAADKTRSILLLAASAAESKGVELSPKGLEHFAEAIDPEWEERQGDKQNKDKRNKNKDKQEEDETINGVVLQKKANESEENNPLLLIMNKLPGKNKQRWITLPFEFSQNGRNFRVSMRVLVDGDNAVFTALDIVEPGKDFRYSFALEFENNKVSKVCMYVDDQTIPSSLRSKQLKDLTKLFDIPAGNVSIKAGLENPAETEFGEKLLCFVDEAV
ncbi:MAG: hypothetical protein LBU88_00575 [Treponema sp.]|jgi:hypothetical protein|nr:hypothetical protein [Treponema sp.]